MANYVLVHGGDRDGSVWNEVASILSSQGHRVFCPSMTSVTKATLQDNIEEIISCIESNHLNQVILVAHSYGGMVITGVTDKLTDKIAKLVYIDAFVPANGQSLYDIVSEHGFNIEERGLTLDPAVMSKLYCDIKKVLSREKIYIFCLKSEFIDLIYPVYKKIEESNENWLHFSLNAPHACMFTHPRELAVILLGIQCCPLTS